MLTQNVWLNLPGLNAKQLEEVFLKATEKMFGKPDSENFEDFKYDFTDNHM